MRGDDDSAGRPGFGTLRRPVEIRLNRREKRLEVDFEDGARFSYTAEYLRVLSPSAEVQGHTPDQRRTVAGRRDVGVVGLEPIGSYAVRIQFDDLHDSGIYTWNYLYELGVERESRWAGYLAELQEKGLSRDPPGRG